MNFGLSPNFPEHNSLGFRGEEITVPKPEGIFRIITMGGSTTYGFLLDAEEPYPAQLQKLLHETYGYSQVEVINAGVPSYTTWETLVNFEFRVLDLEPDLLIVYDGINDLAARAVSPVVYSSYPVNKGYWLSNPYPLSPSVLYRYVSSKLWNADDLFALDQHFRLYAPEYSISNLSHEEVAHNLAQNPPIYFERNLRHLVALADLYEIPVVFSSWTYYPNETANNMNSMTFEYRQIAVEEQNEVLRIIGANTSAIFFDFANLLPVDRHYWFDDGVHQTADGTLTQAQYYAEFLIAEGLLPE